ncbi:DEHA2G00506p [Debaryomyces hansenii CBS767]|uniref:DEHA2G00506p n=1 Tax=Debaryomyces hansenii (strain ATCC 36239 / CBS 767 / BCRC 21394 / JCM 1990 / NBRC 0083 / IGC 2968) TaxID=284592 RepID=Q6BJR6_DEBHA|nr:DEHA2G00506p [Debaryomyces hansenii CBS767]CAG89999.1 DEHA2G00506p [Debaryomyces hansenii CBS767]|eukprot:XP_461555.1 DEHA2G00506p [Debaryomyces hansenii CBS767]
MNSKFAVLEASLNTKLAVLEASLNTKLAVLEARIDMLDYRYLCLFNYQRRMGAHEAISVPFLDREINQEELPPILSVENINRLTKEQCQNYLMGYKVQFHPNETVKLKEMLRDVVGLMASHDLNYQFSTFFP